MRDYNFFSAFDKKKGLDINPKSPYFIATIIVLIIILLSVGLLIRNLMLNTELDELNESVIAVLASEEYKQAELFNQELILLNDYDKAAQQVLSDFEKFNVLGTATLDKLSANLPVNVSTLNLSINSATMIGTFSVPDKNTAAELLLRLKESGMFSSVHSSLLLQGENQVGYVINIECQMGRGAVE